MNLKKIGNPTLSWKILLAITSFHKSAQGIDKKNSQWSKW